MSLYKQDKINQLKNEISELEKETERLSAVEQSVKIVLNGGYGALGANQFRWYDETIAEGITTTGQVAIKYITKKINEYVAKEIGIPGYDATVSSDTDSLVSNTVLNTSIGDITIGDLYDRYTNENTELNQNKKDSVRKLIQPIKSLSYNSNLNKLEYNDVKYIMKHKVKKRMFRIKSCDNYVDVTEDHSVIINRNGNIMSIKPIDIIKGDKIIEIVGLGV